MLPIITLGMRGAGAVGVVTLSGETITHNTLDPTVAQAAVVVSTDGKMYKDVSGGNIQIDSATDWIIPNQRANTTYQVRVTSVVWNDAGDGASFTTNFAADDVWAAITADAEWQITQSVVGQKDVTFSLELRSGSGATLASTSYTLHAGMT